MHGTMFSSGEVVSTVDFSVKSTLKIKANERDYIKINVALPDSFRYMMDDMDSSRIGEKEFPETYFVGGSYIYDQDKNNAIFCMYAICPENEYMIFAWPDQPDTYIVASTDPETDASEILAYFDAFIQAYIAP